MPLQILTRRLVRFHSSLYLCIRTSNNFSSFLQGMTFASRSGFAQDVALINYRYASFLRSNNMSNKEAEYHLENARTSYEGWGYRSNIRVDGTDSAVIGSSLKSLNKIKHTIVKKVSA
jgi:hypothetical protein